GASAGCDVIQIFSKNSNQWKAKPLTSAEMSRFKKAREETTVQPMMVHSAYLINLCSPRSEDWEKSTEALYIEMERAEALEIPYLVLHPGAHLGTGAAAGIAQAAKALNRLHGRTAGFKMKILIELTAGQGTCVGHRFEEVRAILDLIREPERLGVCFDTCHVFAAGYDIRTRDGYNEVMSELDRTIGLRQIRAFHLNDCKKDLGCRVDRHEHIGQGKMGKEPFDCLMNDPRFYGIPMVLETPKGKDLKEDKINLALLRGFRAT
ncbi:MAG: deoxyribonuclease IV, partial [Nitrospiria bacterium]